MAKRAATTRSRHLLVWGGRGRAAAWLALAVVAIAGTVALWAWLGRPRELTLDVGIAARSGGAADLDVGRIRSLVERFASLETRVTGYGGAGRAAEIILAELKRSGIRDVQVQPFQVSVPIVDSAELRCPSRDVTVPLHPLWPNLARTSQTPPAGVAGPLVYVGKGADHELAGKRIQGALLVMDWDSGTEWLAAGEFGAAAVIFRAGPGASGYTARSKFLTVPANIPRFYVAEEDLPALDGLLADRSQAVVRCEMAWRQVQSCNILARVCGSDGPASADEAPIVFHAYYDSISVVPDLSPGAEQACGAATALELARFLRALPQPLRRPVYVLFTGGHGQALAGMTHFISRLRERLAGQGGDQEARTLLARMGRPGLFVGLDLSSRSDRLGLFCTGHFRGQPIQKLRSKFSVLGQRLAGFASSRTGREDDAESPAAFTDCINLTQGRGWWTYFPYQAPFASEIPTLAGIPGITLATINDDRRHIDTPHDTPERMRFDMLARQILFEPGRGVGLVNLAVALACWDGPFVSSRLDDSWSAVAGRAVWLDQRKDYTPSQPLAKAVAFLKTNRGDKFLLGTRGMTVTLTDEQGRFEFAGLIRASANNQFNNCLVEAYGMADEEFLQANPSACREYLQALARAGREAEEIPPDGSIIFAVDMARPKEYAWKVKVLKASQHLNLVCFPCKSISLFALTDPREYIELSDMQILDAATQSPPFQFGQSATDSSIGRTEENCVTLWADPTIRIRLTFGFGYQKRRLILINGTPDNPVGEGFVLDELETIPSMVLQGAGDMWNLDQFRMDKLKLHGVRNPRVRKIHQESAEHLQRAREALAAYDYQTYRSAAETGWALESKAYGELLSTTTNMIRGVLFYLAMLLPFSYCLERLLLAGGTIRRRILGMVSIFTAGFIVLAVVHPAFRFTLTPLIVLLAFIIISLAGVVSLLIVGKFDRMLRERKQAIAGVHEDIRNVGRIAIHAVDLGIANIRRRPRRGFLTAMTIVLVTFTLLSFTSLVPELNISKLGHISGYPSAYKGLMARARNWAPLPPPLYDSLLRDYTGGQSDRSVVAGRAWFFSDLSGQLSQIDLAVPEEDRPPAGQAKGYFTAVALLCMEHTEPAVTGVHRALLPGGRWFKDADEAAIILPQRMAGILGLGPEDVGKKVLLFGEALPLIGLIDPAKFDAILDVDGEPITPVDFVQQEQMQAASDTAEELADTLEEYVHYSSDRVAIIPLKYGRRLGAAFRSVAVRTAPALEPDAEAERFARRSSGTILASNGQAVTLYASVDSARLGVAGQIVVPVILGFVMVLGTMLGSVYERRREIFVYNSVGLSPANVASLFLAESSVYAILGASAGYLLGQVISKILLASGVLAGLNLNYSAGATVFVTVLTMGIVLLSTLYPARQAFLAAVPETHRARGVSGDATAVDRISMFMPFVATAGTMLGMQAYMHEFLRSLEGVTVGILAVDDLSVRLDRRAGQEEPVLCFRAWVAPFDLGVSYDVELRIAYREDRSVHQYHLTAVRYSGDQQNWRRLAPRFLLAVRKQLLMWRILSDEAVSKYRQAGEALFGRSARKDDADG